MSNFQLRKQDIIGVDDDGGPIGSEPVVLAETGETNTKSLRLLMDDLIKNYDACGESRDSYVIWITATPAEKQEKAG